MPGWLGGENSFLPTYLATESHLIRTEMEVPELPALQVVTHVRRLLLASQGVLPYVDSSAPAHSQHAPLADVTPGGRTGGEVGVQRLVGA